MLQHNDRNVIQQALKNFLEIAGPENGVSLQMFIF